MSQIIEIFRLIRVVNCLLAAVGVAIGAWMTWFTPVYFGPTVAAIAAFCVCAAGNVVNDLRDVEVDRINRPKRVLVRGALSPAFARNLAIGLNLVAVLLAVSVSWWLAVVALITILLLLAYNMTLKKIPLAGNVVVALTAGLTFLTGGIAVDPYLAFRLPGPIIPMAFAFFFHLVREIVKDVQDIEGDRRSGVRTLPQIIGVSASLLTALGLFVVLTVLTCMPIFFGWFGDTYKVIAVYVVDLPLLALLIFLWGNPSSRMLAASSAFLKIGMTLGVVALVLA
ncbi:MAG: UbiA family prenyltransferase [bacterium]|nr:UbiA family prenyltransferase [bacterium]